METEDPLPCSKQPVIFSSPLHRHSSWRSNLLLSSQSRLCLASVLFHSRFPNKPFMHLSPTPHVPHAHAFHSSWFDHPNKIWQGAQIINPLKPELNPICYFLALLGAHHFLHVSRIRVKLLTLRWLMSHIYIYIYGASILDVSRSHTTTQHSR